MALPHDQPFVMRMRGLLCCHIVLLLTLLNLTVLWQTAHARNADPAGSVVDESVIAARLAAPSGSDNTTEIAEPDGGNVPEAFRLANALEKNRPGGISAKQQQPVVASESGEFEVELLPLNNNIPLHELHDWTVRILDVRAKRYIRPEHISITGGMKAHGHGLPTTPRFAGIQGDKIMLGGVRFNMAGKWHLLIKFVYRSKAETALFELEFATNTATPENDPAASGHTARHNQGSNHNHNQDGYPVSTTINWTQHEVALLRSLSLLSGSLQVNTTGSAYYNNAAAAAFGHKLFFDKRLSAGGQLSCASCHEPTTYFNDQKITAKGLDRLDRNTPTLVGSGLHRWLYWDGRRDSLWSQALVPLEAPAEMGSSRVAVARIIARHYREEYESVFGALPILPDTSEVPDGANPLANDEARKLWNSVSPEKRHSINTVFTNVGKAIAAYEMILMPAPARFDFYVDQLQVQATRAGTSGSGNTNENIMVHHDVSAATSPESDNGYMSELELKGMKLFISNKTQCMNCHNSPVFSNYGFHNIGTGITADGKFDFGRMMGSQAVLYNEFNCRSRFADLVSSDNETTQPRCAELDHIDQHSGSTKMRGAFRVPGLRGLDKSAPYMHDGRYSSLDEVIRHYADPPAYLLGQFHEMPSIETLSKSDIDALTAFLLTLGSEIDADPHWLEAPAQ